ncbi:hypothetical protein TorRG33x02_356790, partial [Trema orientale]
MRLALATHASQIQALLTRMVMYFLETVVWLAIEAMYGRKSDRAILEVALEEERNEP